MEDFKPERRTCSFLEKTMVLLNDLIEKFHLVDFNLFFFQSVFIEGIKCGLMATTFINVDLIWTAILFESLFEKRLVGYGVTLIAKKEVNRMAEFINSPVEINPTPIESDIGFIHTPNAVDWLLPGANPGVYKR